MFLQLRMGEGDKYVAIKDPGLAEFCQDTSGRMDDLTRLGSLFDL